MILKLIHKLIFLLFIYKNVNEIGHNHIMNSKFDQVLNFEIVKLSLSKFLNDKWINKIQLKIQIRTFACAHLSNWTIKIILFLKFNNNI